MKRSLLILGLSILAAASVANVTFQSRAAQVGPLLDALSTANKIKLKAVGPLARQVVLVDVKDQPLDVFMKHLAAVTAGAWTQNGDTYELAESQSLVKADEAADIALRAKGFARSLANQVKAAGGQPTSETDIYRMLADLKSTWDQIQTNPDDPSGSLYEKAQKIQDALPVTQFVRKVLVSIPPAELAALPLDTRVVFSTNPNRMQRPLGNIAQRGLAQFAQEFSMLNAAMARFPREQQDMFTGTIGGFLSRGTPSKLILACTRYAGDNVSIEAQVVDQRGGILASNSTNLSGMEFGEEAWTGPVKDPAIKKEVPIDPQIDKNETVLKISEESKTYYALASRGADGSKGGLELVQEPLKSKVMNPEQYDPLSYGISDLLIGAAADKKKPIIALVPDNAYLYEGGAIKASQLFKQLEDMSVMTITDKDGWLLGRPARPSDARLSRVNRTAYGQLLRTVYQQGRINLGNIAKFSIDQGNNPGYDSFYVQTLYSFFGGFLAGYDLSNWEANRFYGYLGEQGRQQMAGKVVNFQSLPAEAQRELAKLVYKQPAIQIGSFDEIPSTDQNGEATSFNPCLDPTERLPNGIPGNTQVRLTLMQDPVVIPAAGFAYPLGASELASQVAMEERPDLFPWAQEAKLPDRFKMATRASYSFDFQFGGSLMYQLQQWDYEMKDNQVITRSQLPASFKEEYEKQIKEMREAYKNMKSQGGRNGGQPPPAK